MRVNGILLVFSFCYICGAVSRSTLGCDFACGYGRVRVAAFFEKVAHLLAFDGVVTKKAP